MRLSPLPLIIAALYPQLRFDKGGSPPAAPPPPDPVKTVRAQALATPSVYTPQGSSVYSGDPSAGTFARTDTLSPAQQEQFDLRNKLASSMLDRSNRLSSQLPAAPLTPGMDSEGTKAYWDREKSLLDTTFDRSDRQREQKLANQGLPIGSEAYTGEMDRADLAKSQAYERAAQGAVGEGFQQDLAARQQNFNELATQMAGSQVNPATGQSFVDPSAALDAQQIGQNRQYQGQLAGYNADVATNNANTQTAGTAASLAAMYFMAGGAF